MCYHKSILSVIAFFCHSPLTYVVYLYRFFSISGHLTDVEARELEVRQMREIQYLQQQCHEGGRLLAASREENTTLQHQIKESDEYATQAAEMVTVSRTRLAEAMEANETIRKENDVLRVKDEEWRQRDRDLKTRIDIANKRLNEVRKSADLQKLHRKEEDDAARRERARKQEAGFAAIARAESARLDRERFAGGYAGAQYAARNAIYSNNIRGPVSGSYQHQNQTMHQHTSMNAPLFQKRHAHPQDMPTSSEMVYNQRAVLHQAQAQRHVPSHTNGYHMSVNTRATGLGPGSQHQIGYNPYAGYGPGSPQRSPTGIEGNSGRSPYSPSHGSVRSTAAGASVPAQADSYTSSMGTGHNTVFNNPYRAALLAANGITPDKLPAPLSPDDQWKADVELLQKIIVDGAHVGTSDPGTMKAHVGNMLRQLNPLRFPDRAVVKQFLAKAVREGIVLESGEGGTKALHLPSDFAGVTNRYPTIAQASEAFAILSGQDRSLNDARRTVKEIIKEDHLPEHRYTGQMMTDKEREENDAYLDQFRKKKKPDAGAKSDELAGAGFASIVPMKQTSTPSINSYGAPTTTTSPANNNTLSGSGLFAGFGAGESSLAGFASIHAQPMPSAGPVTLTNSNSSDNGGSDYGLSRLSMTRGHN